ncbi:pyridoxine 5'-phosphate oxidase C-terminal domain-containing protein [Rufibacter glacialis]|uniref:Pyridoxine 5'-phosphate oxidase C-terminal domain-containing protein n=1 Tax=Rufibacter glacialis TaxID=1259555 RepID=A0ABV4RJU3_9BACT
MPKRPDNWGGYAIKPTRIEFMEFKPTRFHNRKLYILENQKWILKALQP